MVFQNKTAQTHVMPLSILSLTVDWKVIPKENNNQVIIQWMIAGCAQHLTFSTRTLSWAWQLFLSSRQKVSFHERTFFLFLPWSVSECGCGAVKSNWNSTKFVRNCSHLFSGDIWLFNTEPHQEGTRAKLNWKTQIQNRTTWHAVTSIRAMDKAFLLGVFCQNTSK